jgi:hypothetical protein
MTEKRYVPYTHFSPSLLGEGSHCTYTYLICFSRFAVRIYDIRVPVCVRVLDFTLLAVRTMVIDLTLTADSRWHVALFII